jgi:hypothetical protein
MEFNCFFFFRRGSVRLRSGQVFADYADLLAGFAYLPVAFFGASTT